MLTMENNINLKEDEYFEGSVPYCKNCKTARYFIRENFCVPCKCQCQMEQIEKKYEEERQAKVKEYLEKLKEQSLLGERYKNCNFNSIEVINDEHQKVINRLKTYCSGFKIHNEGLGIYLFGTNGSGKTLLTACMLDKLNNQFIECMFSNIHKIKEELLSADPKRQKAFLQRVYSVPVLFLDDFATEIVKKNGEDNWLQDIIYDIINTRYNNMLPIIYTSNCSLKECLEVKGILKKTVDRIFESTGQIKLELPSYRLRKKEDVYF